MESSEKAAKAPRDLLKILATVTRCWQWGSALFIALSVNLLFHQTHIYSPRVRTIQPLVLVSLVYSTIIIVSVCLFNGVERLRRSSWHIFALTSIPGDLLMLSVFVAKVAVLSIEYFECSVLSRTNSFEDYLTQGTREKILSLVGGPPAVAGHPQCHFPKELYALCIVAFVSYIMSLLFTIFQLWRYRKVISTDEARPHPEPIERVARPAYHVVMAQVERPSALGFNAEAGPSHGRDPVPTPQSYDNAKYANMPEGIVASMAMGRLSQESTSTFNPDLYLVTDGFRRPDEPPPYTSRPPSLHGR